MQFRRVMVVILSASAFAACGGGEDETVRTAAVDEAPPEAPTPPPPTSSDVAATPSPAEPTSTPEQPAAAPEQSAEPTPTPSTKPTYIPAPEETPVRKKRPPRGPDDATHGSLTLTLTDFAFSSKDVKAESGKLKVTIENVSPSAHEIVFAPEGGGAPVAKLPRTAPGKRLEQTITLSSGTYSFYCGVDNHAEEGMRGRIQVS